MIWFQDFFPKTSRKGQQASEFETYLSNYVAALCPKNYKKDVFRRSIEIARYDFAPAAVKLIGSINGRYSGSDLHKYGKKRLSALF